MEIIEDQNFKKVSAAELRRSGTTFENCSFEYCDFADADLSNLTFIDCRFNDCNLSLTRIFKTGFQNIKFSNCKLSGTDFSKSSDFLFEVCFDHCLLDNAIFYQKKNKGAIFSDCSLTETDFTEADLSNAIFDNCNFNRAFFDRTQLKGADLSTSYNFIIDPDLNSVKKARFSVHGLAGLLSKYDIVIK